MTFDLGSHVLEHATRDWCSSCGTYRTFWRGACLLTDRHLAPCPDCGRPVNGGCRDCDPEGAVGADVDAALEAMDDARDEQDVSW